MAVHRRGVAMQPRQPLHLPVCSRGSVWHVWCARSGAGAALSAVGRVRSGVVGRDSDCALAIRAFALEPARQGRLQPRLSCSFSGLRPCFLSPSLRVQWTPPPVRLPPPAASLARPWRHRRGLQLKRQVRDDACGTCARRAHVFARADPIDRKEIKAPTSVK